MSFNLQTLLRGARALAAMAFVFTADRKSVV